MIPAVISKDCGQRCSATGTWKTCAFHFPHLQGLQSILRKGDWQVTSAVRSDGEIVAVWPGLRTKLYGVAIDVGSTTIAAHLCDLASGEVLSSAGQMNPQIRFGEDLMSRVSYIMMNEGGDIELTTVVREAINNLIMRGRCRCKRRRRMRLLKLQSLVIRS